MRRWRCFSFMHSEADRPCLRRRPHRALPAWGQGVVGKCELRLRVGSRQQRLAAAPGALLYRGNSADGAGGLECSLSARPWPASKPARVRSAALDWLVTQLAVNPPIEGGHRAPATSRRCSRLWWAWRRGQRSPPMAFALTCGGRAVESPGDALIRCAWSPASRLLG